MRLLDSTRTTYGTKLSDHIWKDNNGQLICRDCIIARTGSYDYLESEIIEGGDRNKIVKVFRTDDEVFDPTSIASFENKPFVDDHPLDNVTPENYRELAKGYMINVRRGTGELSNCLMCDVVITDPDTIDLVVSGEKRELSLGYDTVIKDRGGNYYMTKIRGNHLALVDDGRAGCATIRDSARKIKETGGINMSKKQRIKLFDEDIFEVEEIKEDEDVAVEEVPQDVIAEPETATEEHDDEPTLAEIKALLVEIKEMLSVKDDGEEVEAVEEEKAAEESDIVGDEDPVEEVKEEEEIAEDEEDVEAEDCGDKLLDADEEIEETKVAKDSKSVYKKFSKAKDSNTVAAKANAINKSFQDRYNRAAKKM